MEIWEEILLENAKAKSCIWLQEWQETINLCFLGLGWELAGHVFLLSMRIRLKSLPFFVLDGQGGHTIHTETYFQLDILYSD